MNDADFDAQQTRVLSILERWVTPLGLGPWRAVYAWYRGPLPEPDQKAIATAHTNWPYMQFTLSFNLEQVVEVDDDDYLELLVVHELMHVFLHESREQDDWLNHEERVATMLAKAFIWVRDGALPPQDAGATRRVKEKR